MARGALGIVVAGGAGPLEVLGDGADAALTPFAGKYRFIDFALATLVNSGVTPIRVLTPSPTPALCIHLARARRSGVVLSRPFPLAFPGARPAGRTRAARLARALAACLELDGIRGADAIVVLVADHILQLDVRGLLAAHRSLRADVTLATLPLPPEADDAPPVVVLDAERHVRDVRPRDPSAGGGLAPAWTGDLVVRTAALPALVGVLREEASGESELLAPLVPGLHLAAYDVLDGRLPGAPPGVGAYWHDPTSVETYYAAQMDLCTPRPGLDLYNPAWPVLPAASGLGPAKVVADAAGRPGQALNALVSDGTVIRGGLAVNTVLGHGVVVESRAEVEDSVLLDGCHVGRGARVRRALVGPGAFIADGEEIGYDEAPAAPARRLRSGLTLVPATPAAMVAAAGAR